MSSNQTPLALAKAAILRDLNNGKMYARKPEIFKRVFEPLQSLDTVRVPGIGSHPERRVSLEHPEPEIFDDRLTAMLASALAGVLGEAVQAIEISAVQHE